VAAVAAPRVTTETRTRRFKTRRDERGAVSWLGNLLWIWFAGGAVIAVIYAILGLLLMATIVLFPFGLQLLKLAQLSLFPFGMSLESEWDEYRCSGIGNVIGNILFLPIALVLVAFHIVAGLLCACTCYGIIFTFQHFKLAQMALCPFGSHAVFGQTSESEETTTLRQEMYDQDNLYGDRFNNGNSYTTIRVDTDPGHDGQYAKSAAYH